MFVVIALLHYCSLVDQDKAVVQDCNGKPVHYSIRFLKELLLISDIGFSFTREQHDKSQKLIVSSNSSLDASLLHSLVWMMASCQEEETDLSRLLSIWYILINILIIMIS